MTVTDSCWLDLVLEGGATGMEEDDPLFSHVAFFFFFPAASIPPPIPVIQRPHPPHAAALQYRKVCVPSSPSG